MLYTNSVTNTSARPSVFYNLFRSLRDELFITAKDIQVVNLYHSEYLGSLPPYDERSSDPNYTEFKGQPGKYWNGEFCSEQLSVENQTQETQKDTAISYIFICIAFLYGTAGFFPRFLRLAPQWKLFRFEFTVSVFSGMSITPV